MGPPSTTGRRWRFAVCGAFAGSCLAILLVLWSAFGGALPLQPKGYRVDALFPDGTQLAAQADVRISGVPVGRVVLVRPAGNRIRATLELAGRYVPLRGDVRATLRAKSLLGETYVELTPGARAAAPLRAGATLASARVRPSVELDEIFRSLDARTRAGLRTWLQGQAASVAGRGRDVGDALVRLPAFAEESRELLGLLEAQRADVRGIVRDTGAVSAALTARDHELAALIGHANAVAGSTARRDASLRELFRAAPRFTQEARRTVAALDAFARRADPLVDALHPAARALAPVAADAGPAARELLGAVRALGPLTAASRRGVPAAAEVLDELSGVLGAYDQVARQVNPILQYIRAYRRELIAFIANVTATTQATTRPSKSAQPLHYARAMPVLGPEALASYDRRLGTNRSNPYPLPGESAVAGMPVFDDRNCAAKIPALVGEPPDDPDPRLWARIQSLVLNDGRPVAPACTQQKPAHGGGRYPHVVADASPPIP